MLTKFAVISGEFARRNKPSTFGLVFVLSAVEFFQTLPTVFMSMCKLRRCILLLEEPTPLRSQQLSACHGAVRLKLTRARGKYLSVVKGGKEGIFIRTTCKQNLSPSFQWDI